MANNKLQELTERLYADGLSKGRQEGDRILAQAKAEADQIIAQANLAAQQTIAQARSKSEDMMAKAVSDIKMASFQALEATKNDIVDALSAKIVDERVHDALSGEEFTKQVILAAAQKISAQTACDLAVVLPDTAKAGIGDYVRKEVSAAIGKGIDVTLSKKIKGGLRIGPKDGGYFISLSEDTFNSLIREYLRPATRKVLFGE